MHDTDKNPLWLSTGQRIAHLRTERNMTQANLAEALGDGMTRSNINMCEMGERQFKLGALMKLADIFETTTDYLLGRTECREPDVQAQAAVNYLGLSEKAANTLKEICSTKSRKALDDFFAKADAADFFEKLWSISYSITDMKKQIDKAEYDLANIPPDSTDPDELIEDFTWLDRDIKLARLSFFELQESASNCAETLYNMKEIVQKGKKVIDTLCDEIAAIDENSVMPIILD